MAEVLADAHHAAKVQTFKAVAFFCRDTYSKYLVFLTICLLHD